MKSPQQVTVIQTIAMKTSVIKKRENGRENQRQSIKRRRKRNISTNIGNHQKTLIVLVTVIQEKGIQKRERVRDEILQILT